MPQSIKSRTKCKIALVAALAFLFVSCSKKQERLVLWTNNVDFVSFAELFNSKQDKIRVVAYYYDAPINKLAAAAPSAGPDIFAESFLQAGMQKKYFSNLNFA